jgi:hypothetical protein
LSLTWSLRRSWCRGSIIMFTTFRQWTYPMPPESSIHSYALIYIYISILILHPRHTYSDLQNGLFLSVYLSKFRMHLISLKLLTCPSHFTLLDFITAVNTMCIFLQPPVTSISHRSKHCSHRFVFYNILTLCSSIKA